MTFQGISLPLLSRNAPIPSATTSVSADLNGTPDGLYPPDRCPTSIASKIQAIALGADLSTHRLAFESSEGTVWWICSDYVSEFLKRHGHEDPASYRERTGSEWTDDFFTASWRALC